MICGSGRICIACLDTYALSDGECIYSVTTLLEYGTDFINTAYFYGNEAIVGRAVTKQYGFIWIFLW